MRANADLMGGDVSATSACTHLIWRCPSTADERLLEGCQHTAHCPAAAPTAEAATKSAVSLASSWTSAQHIPICRKRERNSHLGVSGMASCPGCVLSSVSAMTQHCPSTACAQTRHCRAHCCLCSPAHRSGDPSGYPSPGRAAASVQGAPCAAKCSPPGEPAVQSRRRSPSQACGPGGDSTGNS